MFRAYADIIRDLSQPIPSTLIGTIEKKSSKTGKVTKTPYIPWCLCLEALDQAAPGWSSEPIEVREVCGRLYVKVALTLRTLEGDFTQCGIGWDEDLDNDEFGGPFAHAYAQATKRAAVLFGFGRQLYDKTGILQRFRQHVATQSRTTPSRPLMPPGVSQTEDRAQAWHDLFAQLSDACAEQGFLSARWVKWLHKEYGENQPQWVTRDLSLAQLKEAITRVQERDFTPEQVRFLSARQAPESPESEQEPPEYATVGTDGEERVNPLTGEIFE
jgi:hypothetical protein